MEFIENPDGIITCSVDKHVKLWSLEGELWGDIYLMKEKYDKKWKYPFDWLQKKDEEIDRVKMLMSIVEGSSDREFNDSPGKAKGEEEIIFA